MSVVEVDVVVWVQMCGGGRVPKQVRVVVVAWRSKVKGHLSMHVHQLASNETRLNERCRLLIRPLLSAPMPGPGAGRSQFFRCMWS